MRQLKNISSFQSATIKKQHCHNVRKLYFLMTAKYIFFILLREKLA